MSLIKVDTKITDLGLSQSIIESYEEFAKQLIPLREELSTLTPGVDEDSNKANAIAKKIGTICSGLDKQKKSDKAYYITVNKFIDSVYNSVEGDARAIQSEAKEIANYFENQEKARKKAIFDKRAAILAGMPDIPQPVDMDTISDEEFGLYLTTMSKLIEEKAKRKLEEEEELKRQKEEIERLRIENEALRNQQHVNVSIEPRQPLVATNPVNVHAKMNEWVESFRIPTIQQTCMVPDQIKTIQDINDKFDGFKAWAKKQIAALNNNN